MLYNRVIPTDFFNESKLLKCLGQLVLKIDENRTLRNKIEVPEYGEEPFEIHLNKSLNVLHCLNYNFIEKVTDIPLSFMTPYNSKGNYPLEFMIEHGDIMEVFNDDGSLSNEFLQYWDYR